MAWRPFDKLVVTPLVSRFPLFITTFTGVHYQSLTWGRWIKSTNFKTIYLDLIHIFHIISRFSKTQELPASYSQLITAYIYYCIILCAVAMVNMVRVWWRMFTPCLSQNEGYTLLAFAFPPCLHRKFLWHIYYFNAYYSFMWLIYGHNWRIQSFAMSVAHLFQAVIP